MKPQPEIFRAAVERAGCRPEECFYTDDIAAYVDGRARRWGSTPCSSNRRRNWSGSLTRARHSLGLTKKPGVTRDARLRSTRNPLGGSDSRVEETRYASRPPWPRQAISQPVT